VMTPYMCYLLPAWQSRRAEAAPTASRKTTMTHH
jgi:hypothetical protein